MNSYQTKFQQLYLIQLSMDNKAAYLPIRNQPIPSMNCVFCDYSFVVLSCTTAEC